MERFANSTVIVAGGTGGLGRAVSLAFLVEGAHVFVPYRKQTEFDSLLAASGDAKQRLTGKTLDVTDDGAVRAMVSSVADQRKRIDVLVNCVGGYNAGKNTWETDSAVVDQMFALNFKSGLALFRAVVPIMVKAGRGVIVNTIAKAAGDHSAGASAYAASKSAALAMTDCLANELENTGVRVNSILPVIIDTEANRKAMRNADFSKWAKPEDLAEVILFLCSEEAAAVHGAAIPV